MLFCVIPSLADIYPLSCTAVFIQFFAGKLYSAVAAAACGENGIKSLERLIEINLYIVGNSERTNAADGVTDAGINLVGCEHLGFLVEHTLVL